MTAPDRLNALVGEALAEKLADAWGLLDEEIARLPHAVLEAAGEDAEVDRQCEPAQVGEEAAQANGKALADVADAVHVPPQRPVEFLFLMVAQGCGDGSKGMASLRVVGEGMVGDRRGERGREKKAPGEDSRQRGKTQGSLWSPVGPLLLHSPTEVEEDDELVRVRLDPGSGLRRPVSVGHEEAKPPGGLVELVESLLLAAAEDDLGELGAGGKEAHGPQHVGLALVPDGAGHGLEGDVVRAHEAPRLEGLELVVLRLAHEADVGKLQGKAGGAVDSAWEEQSGEAARIREALAESEVALGRRVSGRLPCGSSCWDSSTWWTCWTVSGRLTSCMRLRTIWSRNCSMLAGVPRCWGGTL